METVYYHGVKLRHMARPVIVVWHTDTVEQRVALVAWADTIEADALDMPVDYLMMAEDWARAHGYHVEEWGNTPAHAGKHLERMHISVTSEDCWTGLKENGDADAS